MSNPTGLSAAGAQLIRTWEGFYARPYNDPVGHCTVGVGELLHYGGCSRAEFNRAPITSAQALETLRRSVANKYAVVLKSIHVPINQGMCDAILSLTYNIGVGAFQGSTVLKRLNAKDYSGACSAFDMWIYAGGRVFQGLVNRRNSEQEMWLSGDSPIAREMPKLTPFQAQLIGTAEKAHTEKELTQVILRLKNQLIRTKGEKKAEELTKTTRDGYNRRLEIIKREIKQANKELDKLKENTNE